MHLSVSCIFSGLNKVHVVTSSSQCRLRVEISDWDGASAWAEYRLIAFCFICALSFCLLKAFTYCFTSAFS